MAEELLAMLNSGNFRQEALKKKLSDHIEGLAASNCTVEIEDESTGASGNYVLKESIRTGRFIISRTNSTRSMKSGKTDPVAYINPVALSDSSMNASRSATTSLQSTETPAPKQVTNEPSSPREGKSRETPILSR